MSVAIDNKAVIGGRKKQFDAEFETNTDDKSDTLGPAKLCIGSFTCVLNSRVVVP